MRYIFIIAFIMTFVLSIGCQSVVKKTTPASDTNITILVDGVDITDVCEVYIDHHQTMVQWTN